VGRDPAPAVRPDPDRRSRSWSPEASACNLADDGGDVEGLLRSSDTAMYDAKSRGSNQLQLERLTPGSSGDSTWRCGCAMERDDQPTTSPAGCMEQPIVGFEALLRWRDGTRVALRLRSDAEDMRLINSLGRWVLRGRRPGEGLARRQPRRGRGLSEPRRCSSGATADVDEVVAAGVDPTSSSSR
jgi:hypothetical protein